MGTMKTHWKRIQTRWVLCNRNHNNMCQLGTIRDRVLSDAPPPLLQSCLQANVLMLNAQNRALATNLFKYKRKLDIMGASLGEASKKSATCDSLVSVISRRLQQVRGRLSPPLHLIMLKFQHSALMYLPVAGYSKHRHGVRCLSAFFHSDSIVAALPREFCVVQLEDDLHSTLSMLPSDAVSAELQTSLASISKEQPDWSSCKCMQLVVCLACLPAFCETTRLSGQLLKGLVHLSCTRALHRLYLFSLPCLV